MYIQRRAGQKGADLTKSFQDGVHLLAGLHFSQLIVISTTALRKASQQTNARRQHHNPS